MSSPSETSPEQSVMVSSPVAADATIEDSASSTRRIGPSPDVTVQFISNAPNTAFDMRLRTVHARSASPQPRRTIVSPGLSVAQQRARTAEIQAKTALSGVGDVVEETSRVRAVAEDAIAMARSVHEEVASKISEVAKRVDASASGMADSVTGKMREMAAYSDAHTTHAVSELQTRTREYVEGQHRDLEAQILQTRAEARQTA